MYYKVDCESPIGKITMASDGESLTGLWLEGQKYFGRTAGNELCRRDDLPVFAAAKSWLERYFSGRQPTISELPLAPFGSEFQKGVWALLCQIPYGEVTTYGAIGKQIAKRDCLPAMSARAVGQAVAHNPISIIIPCHRVVGADGRLTGYAGGVDRKRWLLELEGVDMARHIFP